VFDPLFALGAAVVWAVSPIYYRGFLREFDVLSFDFLRNVVAASVLGVLTIGLGLNAGSGVFYAVLAGPATLGVGDIMFLLSIRETGASVAAPVVYTYVLMIQLVGFTLGQAIPYSNFLAAGLVILGVFVLSRGGGGRPRKKGIAFALGAGVAWTAGQELIQQATNGGGNFIAITFARNSAATLALGAAVLLTMKSRTWPKSVSGRHWAFISVMVLSDLVLGSLMFVYSISTIGVAVTVILTSVSPLLTQVFSKALGKESPTPMDYLGGILIVCALILAVGA